MTPEGNYAQYKQKVQAATKEVRDWWKGRSLVEKGELAVAAGLAAMALRIGTRVARRRLPELKEYAAPRLTSLASDIRREVTPHYRAAVAAVRTNVLHPLKDELRSRLNGNGSAQRRQSAEPASPLPPDEQNGVGDVAPGADLVTTGPQSSGATTI